MEQHQPNLQSKQEGLVDLLEIYHARQLQEQVLEQLRRIRSSDAPTPLIAVAQSRQVRSYYESLLVTLSELLHAVGDNG